MHGSCIVIRMMELDMAEASIANTTFPGGALTVGQTVSINFNMRDNPIPDYHKEALSLLNSSGNAITFGIFGGDRPIRNRQRILL